MQLYMQHWIFNIGAMQNRPADQRRPHAVFVHYWYLVELLTETNRIPATSASCQPYTIAEFGLQKKIICVGLLGGLCIFFFQNTFSEIRNNELHTHYSTQAVCRLWSSARSGSKRRETFVARKSSLPSSDSFLQRRLAVPHTTSNKINCYERQRLLLNGRKERRGEKKTFYKFFCRLGKLDRVGTHCHCRYQALHTLTSNLLFHYTCV